MLDTCGALAPTRNCKNDLASWLARIGGCSVLRTDVSDAPQMRQEGVPCLFSIQLLLARLSTLRIIFYIYIYIYI